MDIWDINHSEYVTRTRAGLTLLGLPVERLKVIHIAPVRILAPGSGRSPDAPIPVGEVLGGIPASALRLALLRTPASDPLETTLEAMTQGYLAIGKAQQRMAKTQQFFPDRSPIAEAFVVQWERALSSASPASSYAVRSASGGRNCKNRKNF